MYLSVKQYTHMVNNVVLGLEREIQKPEGALRCCSCLVAARRHSDGYCVVGLCLGTKAQRDDKSAGQNGNTERKRLIRMSLEQYHDTLSNA